MPARKPHPTEAEERYLHVVEELRSKRAPFSHPEMQKRLGYKSIASAWQIYEQLVAKGLMTPVGQSVVVLKGPTTTEKARRYLRNARAA